METKLFWIRVENTKTGVKHPSGFAPCDHETACRLLAKMANGPDRRNFLEELDEREMELFDFDVESVTYSTNVGTRRYFRAIIMSAEALRSCTRGGYELLTDDLVLDGLQFLQEKYPKRVEA